MRIEYGDIFELFNEGDTLLTTTNGIVKRDGSLVMGAGSAKEFSDKVPNMAKALGSLVKEKGNVPHIVTATLINNKECLVGSFPTKHSYKDKSDLNLIVSSAKYIVELANKSSLRCVRMTAPGCGLGGLNWEDVKNALEPIFDDRFIIHFKEKKENIVKRSDVAPKSFALIVAGSRGFNNYPELERVCDFMLSKKIAEGYSITIISGTANGADKLGEQYAINRGFGLVRMPADWSLGKRAGHIRNRAMAIKAITDFEDGACIGFRVNNSRGTTVMLDICKELNLKHLAKDYTM